MAYYSILAVTPTDESWISGYLSVVTDLVTRHHGKYLARTSEHERLEGTGDDPAVCVIIEWPARENAMAFMGDPDYAPLLKARTDGSVSHHHLVSGQDDVG